MRPPVRAARRIGRRHLLAALFACVALPVFADTVAEDAKRGAPPLDVPYVPTKQEVVEEMLRVAGVTPGDVVLDLGSGDGRIVITAAKKFGARATGVDLDPRRIAEANANAKAAGVSGRVRFREGDLFDADVREASVVTLYLLPDINLRLKPKLLADLKPGARVVSHDFNMGTDWPPEKTVRIGNDLIYLWTIPAKKP